MKIGFIGLGIMGSRMASNLISAGYDLVVWNRTASKADTLIAAGAARADSPAGVAQGCDILITVLAEPGAVRAAALGPDGFLPQLAPQTLWIDCSTVNPSFTRDMAQEAAARNVRFLDAPVAGSKQPAAEGTLLFIVGGSEEDVATAQPLFDVMGRQAIHVGDNGMGTSLKLVFNLLLAQAMLGFAEAMTLGEALGFEQERLFEILIGGPLVAPFIAGKRPLLASGDYEAAFPLKWLTKDVHLAIQTAYELGIALPSGNVTEAVYRLAARHGWREEDFSAIYAFIGEDG